MALAARNESEAGSSYPEEVSLVCTSPPYRANNGSASVAAAITHHRRRTTKIARRRIAVPRFRWRSRPRRGEQRVKRRYRTLHPFKGARPGRRTLGSKRDLSELLADVALFSRCTTRQRRAIARHAQIAELPAGVELIVEGEPGDALFVILDGRAIITKDSVEVNRVGPGASFCELAILDGEPRSATVLSETDVKLAVIGI